MILRIIKGLISPISLLFLSFIFLFYWFSFIFTTHIWPSSDLTFHINTIETLKSLWYTGTVSYYDPYTFTGWPALQFYGFVPFIFTVFVSYLLGLFFSNSVILAVNFSIVFISAALVFSLYYAAKPFFEDLFDDFKEPVLFEHKLYLERVLVLVIFLLTLWFVNFDNQDSSAGIGSPLMTGLYGQMFGWHSLILYIGFIARLIKYNRKKDFIILAISIPVIFLSHTLSALFVFSIGGLCFLWFGERRWKIFKAHIVGFGLLGFWLIPLLALMGEYSIYYPKESTDFVGVILRYPFFSFFKSLGSTISGNFVLINYTFILVWALILTSFISTIIRKTRLLKVFLLFVIFLVVFFSSDFIIKSIPIGIHYYRFSGLLLIMVVLLLSVVSLTWYRKIIELGRYQKSFNLLFISLILICIFFNLFIPQKFISVFKKNENLFAEQFAEQDKVLDYFLEENSEGRVYFEYLSKYRKFPPLFSHHYLPSQIHKKTGYESIVGLQILQTKSYRYIIDRISLLKSDLYTSDILNRGVEIGLDKEKIIEQLKDFGITHLVAGEDKFYENIAEFSIEDPVEISGRKIVKIQETPFNKINLSEKKLVGFIDKKGNFPFSLVDNYFFSTQYLYDNFELIQIEDIESVPEQVEIVLLNDDSELIDENILNEKIVIQTNFIDSSSNIDHYRPIKRNRNKELYLYREIAGYLENTFDVQDKFREVIAEDSIQNLNIENDLLKSEPKLEWGSDSQNFTLTNLIPGEVYRINYSYFPYWYTTDGRLFRGSSERMFFIPNESKAFFKYTKIYSYSTWIGWLLTIFTFIYILRISRKST